MLAAVRDRYGPPEVVEVREVDRPSLAAGVLRPLIDRRFPLSEVVQALRYVDEGRAHGKVIVTMPGL